MYSKVLCIFGIIEFNADKAIIHRVDAEAYIEQEEAESYCEEKIANGEYIAYVIPKLFTLPTGSIGKIDWSRCCNTRPDSCINDIQQ